VVRSATPAPAMTTLGLVRGRPLPALPQWNSVLLVLLKTFYDARLLHDAADCSAGPGRGIRDMSRSGVSLHPVLASQAAIVTRAAVQPLQTPPQRRQNAVDNTVWTLYEAHQLLLRGISGVPALSILIFLNELDRQRGPRNPTDILGENIGGNSNPLPLLGD
jgi:hypothetical protein